MNHVRFGGVAGGRGRAEEDAFEAAVERAMGDRLRAEFPGSGAGWGRKGEPILAQRLYGSITNQDWQHEGGELAGYSFRAAGDLIAAIIGQGDYLDWYCSAPEGEVDEEVAELLAGEGWRPVGEPERARGGP